VTSVADCGVELIVIFTDNKLITSHYQAKHQVWAEKPLNKIKSTFRAVYMHKKDKGKGFSKLYKKHGINSLIMWLIFIKNCNLLAALYLCELL